MSSGISRTVILAACLGVAACAASNGSGTPSSAPVGSSGTASPAARAGYGRAPNVPGPPSEQINIARALADAGKLNEALGVLAGAEANSPTNPDRAYEAGRLDLSAGKYDEALTAFQHVLAAKPGDVRALTARGVALDYLGQPDAAQASYRQALAVDPHNVATANDLAFSLLLHGHPQEARQMLERLQESKDAPENVSDNLAFAYAAGGDIGRAREVLRDRLSAAQVEKIRSLLNSGSVDPARMMATLNGMLATGAVPTPPAAETPVPNHASEPAPQPAQLAAPAPENQVTVQFASAKSEEEAKQVWGDLQERLSDLLDGHPAALQPVERNGGVFWRVRAAGFERLSDTYAFCRKVRAKGVTCFGVAS